MDLLSTILHLICFLFHLTGTMKHCCSLQDCPSSVIISRKSFFPETLRVIYLPYFLDLKVITSIERIDKKINWYKASADSRSMIRVTTEQSSRWWIYLICNWPLKIVSIRSTVEIGFCFICFWDSELNTRSFYFEIQATELSHRLPFCEKFEESIRMSKSENIKENGKCQRKIAFSLFDTSKVLKPTFSTEEGRDFLFGHTYREFSKRSRVQLLLTCYTCDRFIIRTSASSSQYYFREGSSDIL